MQSGNNVRPIDIRDTRNLSHGLGWLLATPKMHVNYMLFILNYAMRPITGEWDYHGSTDPIYLAELMGMLGRVHGQYMFTDGWFNSDPYLGNMLLMDDAARCSDAQRALPQSSIQVRRPFTIGKYAIFHVPTCVTTKLFRFQRLSKQ